MEYKQDSIEPQIEQRYQRLEKIGSGAYGYVWKVRDKATNQILALKKVFLAFQNDIDAKRTFREISILKQLNHPNIVKLKETIKAQNELDLYLVFQYIQCDLFNAIRDGVLNEVHKKYIIYQLARALHYLHSAGVIHRDLKPSNILIDSNCRIKICDFGLSRTLYNYENEKPFMTQFIATRWYRAPEVLFGSTEYAQKSDMWSLGCLIYEMYACRPLLPGNDSVNQIQKLLQLKGMPSDNQMQDLNVDRLDTLLSHFKIAKLPQTNFFKPSWNSKLMLLFHGLLDYSPKNRWNTYEVLNCDFIGQFRAYEELITAKSAVILKISDNKKQTKQYYRNFINKIYVKNTLVKPLKRTTFGSQHRSESPSRRSAATSMRKKLTKNISSSLHSKIALPNNKAASRTLHCTVRSRPSQPSEIRKHRIHKTADSLQMDKQNKYNFARMGKKTSAGSRHLKRDVSKCVIKEDASKKTLKRRALLYNI